ncbi:MAG: hypothetical protein RL537_615 [Actinomycetota bacterium]|jgi:hypothetical protein
MTIRIRKRVNRWTVVLMALTLAAVGIAVVSLNKPLPNYLVAKRELIPGEPITSEDVEMLALDLGILENKYLQEIPSNLVVRSTVPAGELIPLTRVGDQLAENQTAIRLSPATKPAASVVAGALVSVWQVIEIEGQFVPQQLVAAAEVAAVDYAEGLLAEEIPEIELLVGKDQAMLVITALAAESDVFVLPLP